MAAMQSKTYNDLVTVIITTHYRNSTLIESIESVINQTYKNIEIIVVDDSGNQHANSVINNIDYMNMKYIPHDSNRGSQEARTTGIQAARGDYIHFLDDDDILYERKIEKSINKIKSEEEVCVVYSGYTFNGEDKLPSETGASRGDVREEMLSLKPSNYSTCCPSTILFTESLAKRLTPLDRRDYFDGGSLRLKMSLECHFDFIDECLVKRRDSEGSVGDRNRILDERVDIVKDYFDVYMNYDRSVGYHILMNKYCDAWYRLYNHESCIYAPKGIIYMLLSFYYMMKLNSFQLKIILALLLSPFGYLGFKMFRIASETKSSMEKIYS